MKKIFIVLFLLYFAGIFTVQCSRGINVSDKKEIPFKLINNKVIVPVTFGNSRTLDLILDSGFGFDGIILFNSDLTDSIDLINRFIVQIPGAGDGPPSQGIMSDSMKFSSGSYEFFDQNVIILQSTPFRRSELDGVIGYTYFGHYKVAVDYDTKIITLYEPDQLIDESGWEAIPLTMDANNKPHLNIYLSVSGEEPAMLDVYIDYASSLSLEMTIKEGMKFPLPDSYVADYGGYGLSGDVHGKTARISKYRIGRFEFQNVTATFFEGNSRSKDKFADGVISNDALRRFNLIFDYKGKKLLIKPNNSFNEPFEIIN